MNAKQKSVAFYTLGCKLNFSETSTIARQFQEMGFQRVPPTTNADIFVINTCSVTEHADKKCRQAIRKFAKQSPNAFIAVVGCYSQLRPDEIAQIEGVDLVLGTAEKESLPIYINSKGKNTRAKVYNCEVDLINDFFPAYSSGDRTRSFLKVQDGCDYHCTYCTIPLARGKSRNIPIDRAVKQANEIAQQGIKEIILTGVNTGDFGRSTGESFISLLEALNDVNGIERIRISSIEPNLITPDIVNLVAQKGKFLPHFHIPLQSGSNHILGLMKRRYSRELFADKVLNIKGNIPNVFIGVDIIVGFPGETDEDFIQSYQLMKDLKPSFIHVFPYSERPSTPAANFSGKVKSSVITKRAKTLLELSNRLHMDFYAQNVGQTDEVLFESSKKGGRMYGFTKNYVKVEYPHTKELIGKIAKVKLTEISSTGNFLIELIH
jgi:threonylcarbamoyladenosine tRNA methylthiotransferase MtaB